MVVGTAAVLVVRRVIAHAEPIIRARVIESLETRFKTKVELAELDVSVVDGLQVSGKGLKIFGPADPNPSEPGVQPLISLPEFRFRTGVFGLFRTPMHVDTVQLQGLVLNIPPKEDRPRVNEPGSRASKHKEKISITVDKFVCRDTQLIVNTRKPGKEPLDFDISDLVLREIGPGQPLRFDATLVNPKPVGNIQSEGSFGPFREDDPGESPVSGNYSFTHADLGTLKGISGILSSTGSYRGKLGKIEVEGATDTPDFRLASAGHPVALHTDFHAIVDGTDGDTYLEPVRARFLHTSFTANGKVIRVKDPPGHDIELNVVMDHARIEDLLQLGVKTDPPVLSGDIEMHTRMSLPPGPEEVANRLWLDGSFRIPNGEFSNKKIQDHIDSLSLRSQGEPRLAQEHVEVGVPSELSGTFRLDQGLFTFSSLQFVVPGTHADVTGVYSLDGNTFDFHGKLKLQATLSQMTTGWKSLLLKAVDPFFKKDGAGAEIPFKVTGTRSEPHFGLDLGGSKNEAAEQKLSKPETR
ncbi:MAG TPA: AsmA-like C-terminal region-containing protein [Verrucomicrobiae bacterium]|nr:AsmA-like C-terminal region-containing protein [Verrucomicrobiae bacterium]